MPAVPKDNIHDRLEQLEARVAELERLIFPPISEEVFISVCQTMINMDLDYKKEVLS